MQTCEQSLREHRHARSRHRADHHPSFSSTLLDSIYRSIDEPHHPRPGSSHPSALFRDLRAPGKKYPFAASAEQEEGEGEKEGEVEGGNLAHRRRNNRGTLGRWMEEKMCDDRVVLHRNSVAGAAIGVRSRSAPENRSVFVLSSSSSSSNSSSGGRFSSSESESTSTRGGAKARSLCCDAPWPKPIRTRASVRSDTSPPPTKHPPSSSSSDARFSLVKTKAKALRIYDDLKKVKQPISPGNRLSSFLNSLLASKNSKKSKISSSLKQCDENAEFSTTGHGGSYDDGAPVEKWKSGGAPKNARASYGVVFDRKSKYGYENKNQNISACINEVMYKDAISFPQSKLISGDALKNAKIPVPVGRLDDGVFRRKSNPECGHEPPRPPLFRSRSGPSDCVPSSSGDRAVSSFAKIRSVRFNLPGEDEATAAAPTRTRGVGGVAEAVRELARLKKRDPNEGGGPAAARDRSAEEDDGYSSSDLFELENLADIGRRR
ncbi:hypothetical protein BT93_F2547 [Corymbia citriodora subsp. variegata]|nr:hypothetical protein BT93_F2547 [Corymbia citriodora subsp. variegata]